MDDVRLGSTIRVIRIRKRLRQSDVARRAGVRRETVSRLERGGLGRVRVDTLRAITTALGIRAELRLHWQGAELDRVANSAHADLHEAVARHLQSRGDWIWRPEVSFSIYGERGVIDILAWHAPTRSLLIIELKTELADPQGLAATMGRRVRLGAEIARQFGWRPTSVSGWVVAIDTSTNRRRHARYRAMLGPAFPADGRAMRRWLRSPAQPTSALSFWSDVHSGSVRRTISQLKRVRQASKARSRA